MKVKINDKEKEVEFIGGEGYVDGIRFDGHNVLWSFDYKPKTYLKESELSGDEWRKGGELTIYRNDVSVYKEFCRTTERACILASYIIPKLQDFGMWDNIKVGRKLYNHDVPCYIESICDNGEIIVKTEDGKNIPWAFKIEEIKNGEREESDDEWKDYDRVHILSEHLYWFRK